MSVDAKSLYQKHVLEHAKNRKHQGSLEPHTHAARKTNPLCGDRVTVQLNVDDRIGGIRFKVSGCAICKASASMMAEVVEGMTPAEARPLAERLKAAVDPKNPAVADDDPLAAFMGIRHFPTRTRCAMLPWEALDDALDG